MCQRISKNKKLRVAEEKTELNKVIKKTKKLFDKMTNEEREEILDSIDKIDEVVENKVNMEIFDQVITTFTNYSKTNYDKLKKLLEVDRLNISDAYKFDLYITPPHCLQIINNWLDRFFEDVIKEKRKIKILDPAFGFGSLVLHILQKYSKYIDIIDAYEINENTVEIDNQIYKNQKVKIHHESFMEAEIKNNHYDLVLMNPPFKASIDGREEKNAWYWFLVKALEKAKDEVILISPVPSKDKVKIGQQFYLSSPSDAESKRLNKYFNDDPTNTQFSDIDPYLAIKLGECSDFLSIVKGKSTKIKFKTWISLFKKNPYGDTYVNEE